MPIPKRRIRICEPRQSEASGWVKLERDLDRLPGKWRYDNPLMLSDLKVIKIRETEDEKRFYFMAKLETERKCTECPEGTEMKRNGLTDVLKIKDMVLYGRKSVIYYRAQRYQCASCERTYQAVSDEICKLPRKADQTQKKAGRSHRMTRRLFEYIQSQSISSSRSFRNLADEVGVEEHVVRNIFSDHVVELQKNWSIHVSPWLAMDEVYIPSKKNPRCVISLPLKGEVLEILCDNTKAVRLFFERLKRHKDAEKIEVISMDMWRGYRKVVKETLPNVAIVVDRYHAQKLVNEAFKDVMTVIRSTLRKKEQEEFLCRESLLLEGKFGSKKADREKEESEKVSSEKKKKELEKIFNRVPDVAEAYKLKEDFAAFLNSWNYREAREKASAWLVRVQEFATCFYKKYESQCRRNSIKPFSNIHGTMSFWFEEILNYVKFKRRFEKKVSNAFAESINRKIKEINMMGYGYNFGVLHAKIVFGGILRRRPSADSLAKRKKRTLRRGVRSSRVTSSSNMKRVFRAWEDNTEMVNLVENRVLHEGILSRLPIEIKKDDSREKDSLDWYTRLSAENVRLKQGVMERLRGKSTEDEEDAKSCQKDLFSMVATDSSTLIPAQNADLNQTYQSVGKDDCKNNSKGIQLTLF